MKNRAKELGLKNVRINAAGCLDRCELGPTMVIYPEGVWYAVPTKEDVDEVLETHLVKGGRVGRLMLKTADKLPESSPIPTDVTLSLPRGARVVQSAVANDRLVMTLEIDGKLEVRTFDLKTLQPTGRLNFSAAP